ncbi:MAG: hypothetical protein KDB23_25185, partial [Planctomycetales bacterium]|nr:hypothetical protein [Planctomycetales bacterium]
MAHFEYKAVDANGALQRGRLEAPDLATAFKRVEEQGLRVEAIRPLDPIDATALPTLEVAAAASRVAESTPIESSAQSSEDVLQSTWELVAQNRAWIAPAVQHIG